MKKTSIKTSGLSGLKLLHRLTQTGQWEMKIDYQNNGPTTTTISSG